MSELKETKRVSLEEFDKMSEDNAAIYELIDGVIYMTPRPNFTHQSIMSTLIIEIGSYLKGKPCRALTEVELEIEEDVIIPDISVFCNLESTNIQRSKEPPLLAIEILSPSNTAIGMNTKAALYKAHGVKELWIIDPENKVVTKHNLKNDTTISYTGHTSVSSDVFDTFEITLDDIFS